jgi:hypothetical protein
MIIADAIWPAATHVGFGIVDQHGQLGELLWHLIGDHTPLRDGSILTVLSKYGVDQREHHLAITIPACTNALRRKCTRREPSNGFHHFRDSRPDPNVRISDHQLHAAQTRRLSERRKRPRTGPPRTVSRQVHRVDDLVHRAGQDSVHIRFPDHCSERLLSCVRRGSPARRIRSLGQVPNCGR